MFKDGIKANGTVSIVLQDEHGNVKETCKVKNLIVDTGLDFIASRMKDATATAMTHMAAGSGTTAASASDTDLESILGSVELLDSTNVTDNSIVYISTFEAGDATGTVSELGIFNAASGGTMLCRTVLGSAITKSATDQMQVTWTITITAS